MQKSTSQHTLKTAIAVSGVGTHSGAKATLTLKPAQANSGIVFVRTDITDRDNVVPAKWNSVVDTRLCTIIANKAGVTVSTVEHVLSACAALGLDNAVIEVDGPEVPIMDGSARDFVTALDKAGLQRQNAPRRILRVKKTVSYQEGDKEIYLSPADGQYFGFEIDFANPVIGRQKYTHQMKEEIYRKEIASARTFGFVHEVEQLRKMGLARGSSLENAIGIDGDKILNPEGLRFPNEFVRHKILDAIGDLYLCGMQIMGHYHGVKAGHAMNNKLMHVLFSQPDAFEIVELEEPSRLRAVPAGVVYGHQEQIAAVA